MLPIFLSSSCFIISSPSVDKGSSRLSNTASKELHPSSARTKLLPHWQILRSRLSLPQLILLAFCCSAPACTKSHPRKRHPLQWCPQQYNQLLLPVQAMFLYVSTLRPCLK